MLASIAMEERSYCVSLLSLQEMALRKVAVLLWSTPLNLFRICNFQPSSSATFDPRRDWRGTVSYDVSKLKLPRTSIEQKILRISRPVGLQIIRWKLYHEAYLNPRDKYFDAPVLEKLQWTTAGAIDYEKTAEKLVRCDVLHAVKRYKLACLYCLDHHIPGLWEELPHESQTNFCRKRSPFIREPFLPYCWPHILNGEEYRLDRESEDSIPFNQSAFERSCSEGNRAAAEHFLRKLSPEERRLSLMRAIELTLVSSPGRHHDRYPSSFPMKSITDVVFYLLSQMTSEEKTWILMWRPACILGRFLDWPWHDAFSDYSDELWTWMQCEDPESRSLNYNTLLDRMQESIKSSDCYLPDLFQRFFGSCPGDFKRHFVQRECQGHYRSLFPDLFDIADTETVEVILSSLDAEDRLRIAFSNCILNLFRCSVSRGRGDVVEVFVREAGLSKEDKVRLKEVLKTVGGGAVKHGSPEWRKMFEFLESSD